LVSSPTIGIVGVRWNDNTYILTPNKRCVFPAEIIYLDTETQFDPELNEQEHTLRLGVAIRQRYSQGVAKHSPEYFDFTAASQFWAWLECRLRPKVVTWVVAHNMDFDFAIIKGFQTVEDHNWSVKFWAISPGVFLLRLKKDSLTLQFVDSVGFMRTSLHVIGERMGLSKLPMPDPSESDGVWKTYCTRDVEVLKLGMEGYIAFVRDNNLGSLALTGPSQAMTAYRHRFMDERIILHRYDSVIEQERASYHGGRTEAFHIGVVPQTPIYYLDVTSMYAFQMKQNTYPCELLGEFDNPTTADIRQLIKRYELLADCDIDTPLPVVPVRQDKLIFPIGSFRTTLPGPEFIYCWNNGYVRKVHRVIVYRRGRPFPSYVDYFWGVRQMAIEQDDSTMGWFSKLLLNSFYGKWGQRNPVYDVSDSIPGELPGITTVISTVTNRRSSRLTFGGKTWLKTGEAAARFTSVSLASWITSYARIHLWKLFLIAGLDHVYYCDTDSLFVDQVGYERLSKEMIPNTLGALDLRKQGHSLTIYGPKDYVLDHDVALKGIPRSAKKIAEGCYSYMTFDRWRTRLRRGTPDMIYQREVVKSLTRIYDKGEVARSGVVSPFILNSM
jgi:hypothetical protein